MFDPGVAVAGMAVGVVAACAQGFAGARRLAAEDRSGAAGRLVFVRLLVAVAAGAPGFAVAITMGDPRWLAPMVAASAVLVLVAINAGLGAWPESARRDGRFRVRSSLRPVKVLAEGVG